MSEVGACAQSLRAAIKASYIQPIEGYEISQILVNGTTRDIANKIELSLERDTKLQVDFQKKKYSISYSGENVIFENNTSDIFEYGSDVNFDFLVEEGYQITDVLIDGNSVGIRSSYKFVSLNSNHTIKVETERITFAINISADEGVFIENDSNDLFYYHDTPKFQFRAKAGYRISDIRIDGSSIGVVTSFVFPELTKDYTITVISEKIFTITLEYDSGRGQASVDKAEYAEGESAVITLYPKTGYYVSSLRIDSLENMIEMDQESYYLENIKENHIIYVIFTTSKFSEVDDKDTVLDDLLGGEGTGRVTTNEQKQTNGNDAGESGGESGNGSGESSNVSGNDAGESGGESGNGSGDSSNVSGNDAGESGADSGSADGENGNEDGNDDLAGWLDYIPDKTEFSVDDDGNPVNKSAAIYKIELSAGEGWLKYNYIMFYTGSSFKLPVPIREGYDFAGWYVGTRKIERTKDILNASEKLQARWTPAIYRITYDLKGGSFGNTSKVPYLYCINKTTSLKKPVRSGYVFAGWYQKGTDIKIVKLKKGWYYGGTLDLEARWYMRSSGSYSISNNQAATGGKITYDLGGGYFKDPGKVKEYYAFMTSTVLPKPVRTGYRFEGWYVAGTDVRLTKLCKNQYLGDVKLVAMWSRSHYTITYCANKGKGKQDKTTIVYDKIGLIKETVFSRKGYIFTGWNTKANGTGIPYKPGDSVKNLTLKTNIKLYAQWQKLY